MRRRIFGVLLAVMMVLSVFTLTGCSNNKTEDEEVQERLEEQRNARKERGAESKPHLIIVGFRDSFDSVLGIDKDRFSKEDGSINARRDDTDDGQELERQIVEKVAEKLNLNLDDYYLQFIYDEELGSNKYSYIVYSCDEEKNSFDCDSPMAQIDRGIKWLLNESYDGVGYNYPTPDNPPTLVIVSDNISEEDIMKEYGNSANMKVYVLNSGQNSATKPAAKPADELDPLLMSESLARKIGGLYLFKDSKHYSLRGLIDNEKATEYSIGVHSDATGVKLDKATIRPIIHYDGDTPISMGEVPIPKISAKDSLRSYQDTGMIFEKVNFKGYTIPLWTPRYESNAKKFLSDPKTGAMISLREGFDYGNESFKIIDKNTGQEVKDGIFKQNQAYTIRWIKGTDINSVDTIANCKYYELTGKKHTFKGTVVEGGYATYDTPSLVSSIPSGTYLVYPEDNSLVSGTGCIVEITE